MTNPRHFEMKAVLGDGSGEYQFSFRCMQSYARECGVCVWGGGGISAVFGACSPKARERGVGESISAVLVSLPGSIVGDSSYTTRSLLTLIIILNKFVEHVFTGSFIFDVTLIKV